MAALGKAGRVSMQTVAARAGVSKMTVSRALANHPEVGPETKARIARIAADLGYVKSPLVAALMAQIRGKRQSGRLQVIALLHNWPANRPLTPNLRLFRESVQAHAAKMGFRVDLLSPIGSDLPLERALAVLHNRGVRGLILELMWSGRAVIDPRSLRDFAAVSVGNSVSEPRLPSVFSDQHQEILLAMAEARRRGYRRFALVNKETTERMNSYRRRAGLLWAQQAYPPAERLPPLTGCETLEALQPALHAYLRRHRPDVIASQHAEVHDFLLSDGWRIPQEIGFLHLGWHAGDDRFAGIDPNWTHKGVVAVNEVVDLLNRNEFGVPSDPVATIVTSRFCDGRTLRGVRLASEGIA